LSPDAAGTALGLRFTGDHLPGLNEYPGGDLPAVTVERTDAEALEERWQAAEAPELIFERRFQDGRPFLQVEGDAQAGYRVAAVQHGSHLVAADGTHCVSALPDAPPWHALKLLASQTLPLLATLRGREVLHAAGVVVAERLVAIVAASGTGKSATTCNVIAQGGRFFADDVLAMDVADGRVRAHPGTRLLNLFAHDLDEISEPGRGRLGEPLGQSDKAHFAPEGFPGPLPLSGVLFLRRGRDAAATALEPVENASSQLLGNAFLPYLDSSARLAGQLDVMSALAQTVPLVQLEIARGDRPPALAAIVREWAEGLT
jgi:hypothetical protein